MIFAAEGKQNRTLSLAVIREGGGDVLEADQPKRASPGLAEHFGTLAAGEAAFDTDVEFNRCPPHVITFS